MYHFSSRLVFPLAPEPSVCGARLPACLTTSLCPRGHSCDTLEQTPGRGSQGRALSQRAHREMCPGLAPWTQNQEGQEGEPGVCLPLRLKGFTSLHFQLLVFYLGKIPFDSPGGELLIPVSGSFFTSIPQRTDFNAWWIQTKLFPFLWLCKSL